MSVRDRDGGASVGSRALTVDDAVSSFLTLPRHTQSAKSAHRASRGLDAILVSFDKRMQNALRQLIVERLELEARKRTILDRIVTSSSSASAPLPEVLLSINGKISDNDSTIRRMAGSAAPVLLDALKDPALTSALAMDVGAEEEVEEGDDARVWRRQLDTKRINRSEHSHVSHDSPTVTGGRDLHNTLTTAKPEDGLSYYQKQQLKYGRGRRGSTSIAGALEYRVCV